MTIQSLHRVAIKCNDLLVFVFLAWMMIPEEWTKPVALGPLPAIFFITQILACTLFAESLLVRVKVTATKWLILLATAFAVGRGLLLANHNHWDFKFLIVDVWNIECLLLGITWAYRRSFHKLAVPARTLALIAIILCCFTTLGLLIGILHPLLGEYGGRLYTVSLWNISIICTLLWPILYYEELQALQLHGEQKRRGFASRIHRSDLLLACAVAVPIFTATRNLLLLVLPVYILGRLFVPGGNFINTVKALLVIVISLAGVTVIGAAVKVKGDSVVERILETHIEKEQRWTELTGMIQQLDNEWVFGWGMGSLFYSPVMYGGNPLADSPHIGITTGVLKGGVFLQAALVLLPLVFMLKGLFAGTFPSRAGSLCLIGYFVLSSTSGGWLPFEVLLYGIGIGLVEQYVLPERRTRWQPRVLPSAVWPERLS